MNRSRLRQLLDEYFDENELKDLCFDLNVQYENLPAIAKKDKVRELILVMEKDGRLPELIAWGQENNPAAPWDAVLGPAAKDPAQEMERLAHEYDQLRHKQQHGDPNVKTDHLDGLIMSMRDTAMMLTLEDQSEWLNSPSDGQRMAALAYLYVNPDERLLLDLLDIEGMPGVDRHRANEEYYALLAIERLVETTKLDLRPRLKIRDTLQPRQHTYKLINARIRYGVIKNILEKLGDLDW